MPSTCAILYVLNFTKLHTKNFKIEMLNHDFKSYHTNSFSCLAFDKLVEKLFYGVDIIV